MNWLNINGSANLRHGYSGKMQKLRSKLSGNALRPDLDASKVFDLISNDEYLDHSYRDVYTTMMKLLPDGFDQGKVYEIGGGSGIMKRYFPSVIATDVEASEQIDMILDATKIQLNASSVDAYVLKDALHHIPDIEAFFSEALRTLKEGGVVVVCDPYWGILAKFVYRFFHPEPFNGSAKEWRFTPEGPWDSNQALLWILLRRDRKKFEERFPELTITEYPALLGLSYGLSGGVFGRTKISSKYLIRLHDWESGRSRHYNFLRFAKLVVFTKNTTTSTNRAIENV